MKEESFSVGMECPIFCLIDMNIVKLKSFVVFSGINFMWSSTEIGLLLFEGNLQIMQEMKIKSKCSLTSSLYVHQ